MHGRLNASLVHAEGHHIPHIFGRSHDVGADKRLVRLLDALLRKELGIIDLARLSLVHLYPVLDRGGRKDNRQIELTLETLLHDLQMKQTQKPAAESKTERGGAVLLVDERCVVE